MSSTTSGLVALIERTKEARDRITYCAKDVLADINREATAKHLGGRLIVLAMPEDKLEQRYYATA